MPPVGIDGAQPIALLKVTRIRIPASSSSPAPFPADSTPSQIPPNNYLTICVSSYRLLLSRLWRFDLLSLTAEYALRAVVYLARHLDDAPIPGRQIAADLNVPRKYLSSILGDLVRTGLLEASPGRTGGFRLARPPGSVRLLDVVAPFEQVKPSQRPCPFGNATCSDVDPCWGHDRWSRVKEEYGRFLEETTVRDVARPKHELKTARRRTSRKKKK